ncbi:ParB/RepB/Spo0J family partition protein [Nocardiopsis flavescens]|uniref:ParB/RepB/Spo0J family partition protein n=1 Tax=Nocardiopsis flavescens TaxID=758803 RepID=UPI00364F3903
MTAQTTQKAPAKPKKPTPKPKPALKETLEQIQTGRIVPDPTQPRQTFDADKLTELAASMKELGLQQPIVVRWNPDLRKYVIVMGERRWRAARQLSWKTIPARVSTEQGSVLLGQIAENTARSDMSALEEAHAFARAIIDEGRPLETVARAAGRSAAYVTWRMDLLQLTPTAQQAVNDGNLPTNLAWYMRNLSADAQNNLVTAWARGEFASARDAEAAAKARQLIEDNEQGELFHVEELSDAEKDQLRKDRARTLSKIDHLSKAGELLAELAGMDPAALARQLHGVAGGAGVYQDRLAALQATAGRAVANLRKAAAYQAAGDLGRTITVEQMEAAVVEAAAQDPEPTVEEEPAEMDEANVDFEPTEEPTAEQPDATEDLPVTQDDATE